MTEAERENEAAQLAHIARLIDLKHYRELHDLGWDKDLNYERYFQLALEQVDKRHPPRTSRQRKTSISPAAKAELVHHQKDGL